MSSSHVVPSLVLVEKAPIIRGDRSRASSSASHPPTGLWACHTTSIVGFFVAFWGLWLVCFLVVYPHVRHQTSVEDEFAREMHDGPNHRHNLPNYVSHSHVQADFTQLDSDAGALASPLTPPADARISPSTPAAPHIEIPGVESFAPHPSAAAAVSANGRRSAAPFVRSPPPLRLRRPASGTAPTASAPEAMKMYRLYKTKMKSYKEKREREKAMHEQMAPAESLVPEPNTAASAAHHQSSPDHTTNAVTAPSHAANHAVAQETHTTPSAAAAAAPIPIPVRTKMRKSIPIARH
jgi:hypothetical protein